MNNILIHGLGQNAHSWGETSEYLKEKGMETVCPNLFELTRGTSKEYSALARRFFDFCNEREEKLNLCGLSLGGVLALDFVKEYPEKVNSLVLIGTPYQIPKVLFFLQGLVFHFMPKSVFEKMGAEKTDFITLVRSMGNLDIRRNLDRISCRTLILCGEEDRANQKSAELLHSVLGNSQLNLVSGSSHEVNLDNPRELADLLYTFWRKCEP